MKKNLINLVISCAALFSCTANSDEPELSSGLSVECYSRQTEYSESAPVKDFAMFVMDGESPYDGISNPVHVTFGSAWSYPNIMLTSKAASVSAFYPYIEGISYTNIPMDLSKQIDYMSSSVYEVSNKNPEVTFTMDHLLACLEVNIENAPSVILKAENQPKLAYYNMKTQSLKCAEELCEIQAENNLLVYPKTQSLSLIVTYKGESYKYQTPEIAFEKGKKYTLSLKVEEGKNLQINGEIIVNPWGAGGDYSGIIEQEPATYEFLTDTKSLSLSYKASSTPIKITSTKKKNGIIQPNPRFLAESNQEWCTYNDSNVVLEENTDSKPRRATMTFIQDESRKKVVITVTQTGKVNIDVDK